MRDNYLFDRDEFEQNIPLFANTLSRVLRMRQRHGHLVRAVVKTLDVVIDEEDHREIASAVRLLSPKPKKNSKTTSSHIQLSKSDRSQVICDLNEALQFLADQQDMDPKASMLRENLQILGQILALDDVEIEILYCRIMCELSPAFSRLADSIHETLSGTHETLSCLLAVEPHSIHKRLSPDSRLRKSGLIRTDTNQRDFGSSIDLLGRLSVLGFEPLKSVDAAKNILLGRPSLTHLAPTDFKHLSNDLAFVVKILTGAFEQRPSGVNILLYGVPGTGKTEFAKVAALSAGAQLYQIGEEDSDGDEPSRGERIRELNLTQMLLNEGVEPAICCFDEAEDLFNDSSFAFHRPSGSKIFINRLFENNRVPVIWIVNDIEALPVTVRRRMTYALKIDRPSIEVNTRILKKMAKAAGHDFPQNSMASLVRDTGATTGVFAKALQAVDLSSGDFGTLEYVTGGLVQAQNDGEPTKGSKQARSATFRPELSNADVDLPTFVQRLIHAKEQPFSVCLYGASGTGKSAFALHIAEQLGLEFKHVRSSELLGAFVGQTEAAIARTFQRAADERSFLIFDEADALLYDRGSAQRAFEVSQVNELLQAMEAHPIPFACTTNLMDRVDSASMRRFTFRIEFRPLDADQLAACYQHYFSRSAPSGILELAGLTPADFALVKKQATILNLIEDDAEIFRLLEGEWQAKGDTHRIIGFRPNRKLQV